MLAKLSKSKKRDFYNKAPNRLGLCLRCFRLEITGNQLLCYLDQGVVTSGDKEGGDLSIL